MSFHLQPVSCPPRIAVILSLFLFFSLISCSSADELPVENDYGRALPPGTLALELVTDTNEYPDFKIALHSREALLRSIDMSLDYLSKPSSTRIAPIAPEFTHERTVRSLELMRDVLAKAETPEQLNGYIHLYFDVYRSIGWDGSGTVLFTGYCQPIFDGRLTRSQEFSYPLYNLPSDLAKKEDGTPLGRRDGERIVSYFTRREIDGGGVLKSKGLELVWLRSPLDCYVAHVQGSAQIRLPKGEMLHIGYAGKTDREYASLGQALVIDGKIDKNHISLTAIRDWFDEHPDELADYLYRNESYVFFTEMPPGGPFGCLGAPVTAYHSIATDKDVFPRAALACLETILPSQSANGEIVHEPFTSFVLDQDRGGAIKSAGRADIFLGTGDEAEKVAGYTRAEGRLFYLFAKP